MNPKLEIISIKKYFPGTKALDWESDQSVVFESGNIYALLGENGAGKSTLAKILCGIYKPTSGKIILNGAEFNPNNSEEARSAGIGIILQEPGLISSLKVSENLLIGREKEFSKCGIYSMSKMRNMAQQILDQVCPEIKPNQVVRDLLLEEQKLVEFARAIEKWPQVLLVDETSATLSRKNVELIFSLMRAAKAHGSIILFITHRMEEVFEMCNKAVILKDGKLVSVLDTNTTNVDEISRLMVGRTVVATQREKASVISLTNVEPILEVENLSLKEHFSNISFKVKPGQIVGIGGLTGGGKENIMPVIFGDMKQTSGSVKLFGKQITNATTTGSISKGIAFVPRDRENEGLILRHSIKANILLPSIKLRAKHGFVNPKEETAIAKKYTKILGVKCNSIHDYTDLLSGGNRQKVVIARWMALNSKLMLLDNPTRGIDVGARADIYKLLNDLVKSGVAILMVTDDLPELLSLSDEMYIIRKGEVSAHFELGTSPEEYDVVQYMI